MAVTLRAADSVKRASMADGKYSKTEAGPPPPELALYAWRAAHRFNRRIGAQRLAEDSLSPFRTLPVRCGLPSASRKTL